MEPEEPKVESVESTPEPTTPEEKNEVVEENKEPTEEEEKPQEEKKENVPRKKKEKKERVTIDYHNVAQELHDLDWYVRDYTAQQELRHKLYRDVPSIITNPESGIKHLYRELKKNRIFMLRNMNKKLNSLKFHETEENQSVIKQVEASIHTLEKIDLFAVVRYLLPSLYMIPTPKNYQKPISKELEEMQNLLLKKNDVQKWIQRLTELKSIRKNVYQNVGEEVISKSIKETQKESSIDLDKLSKKRRRAAEYKLRMMAENKGSVFLSKLNSGQSLGSSSSRARQEAARTTLLTMNMSDTIDRKMKKMEEQQKEKKMGIKRVPNPKNNKRRKTAPESTPSETKKEAPASVPQPMHPSWVAKNASREKQKLHIDLNAPTVNKKIVFD